MVEKESEYKLTFSANCRIVDPLKPLPELGNKSIVMARGIYYNDYGWFIPQPHQIEEINQNLKAGHLDPSNFRRDDAIDFNNHLDGRDKSGVLNCTTCLVQLNGIPIFTSRVGNELYNLWQNEAYIYSFNREKNRLENLAETDEGRQIQTRLPSRFLDLTRYVPLSVSAHDPKSEAYKLLGKHFFIDKIPQLFPEFPEQGTIMWLGSSEDVRKEFGESEILGDFDAISLGSQGEILLDRVKAVLFRFDTYVNLVRERLAQARNTISLGIRSPADPIVNKLAASLNLFC